VRSSGLSLLAVFVRCCRCRERCTSLRRYYSVPEREVISRTYKQVTNCQLIM